MNSRTVVKLSHLERRCPICLKAVEDDHEEALAEQRWREEVVEVESILSFEILPLAEAL